MYADKNVTPMQEAVPKKDSPKKRSSKVSKLEERIAELESSLRELTHRYETLRKAGLNERHQVMLRHLEHFYIRVINIQGVDAASKKILDEICAEVPLLCQRKTP
jgi:molecular chaperone GrpE (heat shock protein)